MCSLSLILRRVQSRSVRAPRNSSSSISPTPIHQNPRRRWKYRQSPSRQSPPAPQPSLISTTIPPSTNTFVRRAGNCRIGIPRLHPICLTNSHYFCPFRRTRSRQAFANLQKVIPNDHADATGRLEARQLLTGALATFPHTDFDTGGPFARRPRQITRFLWHHDQRQPDTLRARLHLDMRSGS